MLVDIQVETASSELAVTLAEAKAWCRVDYSLEDDLITSLIRTAMETVQAQSGRTLFETTYIQSQGEFPAGTQSLELLRAPIRSVESVEYLDANEELQTLDPDLYRVVSRPLPGRIVMVGRAAWPATPPVSIGDEEGEGAVFVTFKAGITESTPGEIPYALKTAVLMMTAHLFKNREAVASGSMIETPQGVQALIDTQRVDYE